MEDAVDRGALHTIEVEEVRDEKQECGEGEEVLHGETVGIGTS